MTKRKSHIGMIHPWTRRQLKVSSLYFAIQWTMVAVGSGIGAFIAFGYK